MGLPDKERSVFRRKALDYIRVAPEPQAGHKPAPTMLPPAPAIVLDTNVVLDWLVFRDPSCLALGAAIESGQVRWFAAEALRRECDNVLARGVGADRAPDLGALADTWQRLAVIHPAAPPAGGHPPCRCTDPDDQKFIDLALRTGARWLLSRDRAVLKLAGRARRAGLLILPPARWALETPT